MHPKKFCVHSLSEGCPRSLLESAQFRDFLKGKGWVDVGSPHLAEVIVVNSCGGLNKIAKKTTDFIDAFEREYPKRELVISGCLPRVQKWIFAKAKWGIVPPGDVVALGRLLKIELNTEEPSAILGNSVSDLDLAGQPLRMRALEKMRQFYLQFEAKYRSEPLQPLHNFLQSVFITDQFHYVVIGEGCLGRCTYCGRKKARGAPKSEDIDKVLGSFKSGLKNGKRWFWLVSDDLGGWGSDKGTDFTKLLKAILEIEGEFKLVLGFLEPSMLLKHRKDTLDLLKDRRVVQMCIPIQTGSQRLLKTMGREYSIQETIEVVRELKAVNPNLIIKTNVISNFPGEDWKDFVCTLKVIRQFTGIGVNPFSKIKGTQAESFKDSAPLLRIVRSAILTAVCLFHHAAFLVESLSRFRNANKSTWYLKRRKTYSDPVVKVFVSNRIRQIEKSGPLGANQKCLELCAGDGFFSAQLQAKVALLASDKNEDLLSKNPCPKKMVIGIEDIPFASKSFSIVFESLGLHHVADPERAIEEMCRVSSDWVIIVEPNPWNPINMLLSYLVSDEKGIRLMQRKFISNQLFKNDMTIVQQVEFGIITPTRTPAKLLSLLNIFERPIPFFGMDQIWVARRNSEVSK